MKNKVSDDWLSDAEFIAESFRLKMAGKKRPEIEQPKVVIPPGMWFNKMSGFIEPRPRSLWD
jgi:hypothetical protein